MIPHGAFDHLTRVPGERPLPPDLAAVNGPVVLCFGVVRPYKGVDVLLEAFREVPGAELWVVGRPLGESMERLRRLAPPGRVRFVPRYVSDAELAAFFRRADLLVLPHRRVDVSGVLYAGLAFGKPMVLSDVGGFAEVDRARRRPARAAGGPRGAWPPRSASCWPVPTPSARLGERAAAAAAGPYSWDRIAERTLAPLPGGGRVRIVFMGKGKRSTARALDVARRAGLRGAGGGGPRRTSGPSESSAWTWWPGAWAAAPVRGRALRGGGGALGAVDLVISFLFWKRIREPLLSLGRRVPQLPPGAAARPPRRGRVQRGRAGGPPRVGRVLPLRGRRDRHRRPGGGGPLPRSTPPPPPRSRSTWRARSGCSGSSRVLGRALAGQELPRTPQGEGRYVTRAEFEELRASAPATTWSRKVRAFWYPPWPGAVVEVEGGDLTLVDDALLSELAAIYRNVGQIP